MKKIMIMTNALYGGGAEKILQTIISHLDYEKFDVTLYSMHKEAVDHTKYLGNFRYKYVFGGTSRFFGKIKGWIFNHCPSNLFYFLFIHEKYDVEIAFIEGESTKIISGSTNRKSKKYAWVHIDLINNPWTSFLYRSIEDEGSHYRKFDKILCVSNSVRKALIDKFSLDENKVKTQYNPVDKNAILIKSLENCDLPAKTKIRMVAVGRLVKQKGFDRLLYAVNKLKNDGFDFELFILGEGQEYESLRQYITDNALEQNVFLLGYRENPYCYMVACDLLVCSSRAEGFSTVLTEGIMLGMPIISTNCAGVTELFGDSKCGEIVDNDTDSLYTALKNVLLNPTCLLQYQEAARERGKSFSLEIRMKELEAMLSG